MSGTVDKFLFDLVLTERIHALALQCLPNFDHLHMFWGSYVKESRDRPRLSVHSNFVGWSLTLGDAKLDFKWHINHYIR